MKTSKTQARPEEPPSLWGGDERYQFGSLVLYEVGYLLPGPQGYSHFLQVINCAHQLEKNTDKHGH